jgi:hypothetical protein
MKETQQVEELDVRAGGAAREVLDAVVRERPLRW